MNLESRPHLMAKITFVWAELGIKDVHLFLYGIKMGLNTCGEDCEEVIFLMDILERRMDCELLT